MRPFASLISLDEARRRLDAAVQPITRTETLPLATAAGRVLAEDVASLTTVPPFHRSVMDGYAVSAADTTGASKEKPVILRVIDRLHAGDRNRGRVEPGTCIEIATGAPLPDGADAVVMVEQTRPAPSTNGDQRVEILTAASAGQHVNQRGADIRCGDVVAHESEVLSAGKLGAAAAAGRTDLRVYAKPRVAVISTGNEIADAGRPLTDGQIYDVNRFTLGAVIAAHGGSVQPHAPVPDDVEALQSALEEAAGADIIVVSGGSSVGERDFLVDAIAVRQGTMILHGIAVKPGMPTAFARVNGVAVFGMPGNPTSCLSNAYALLVPFLRATARLPPYAPRTLRVPLGRRVSSPAGRHQFYTVRIENGVAVPAFKGSGDITSLSAADGYFEIETNVQSVEEGTMVEVILF